MTSPGKHLRALIVDDHGLYRTGLRLLLQDTLGFHCVVEAGDLVQALAAISNPNLPDLVTFDLSMPGTSGLEGLTAVIDAFPSARILVVSASENRSEILSTLRAGAHAFVPKSFSSDQMKDAITRALAGQIFVPFNLSANRDTPLSEAAATNEATPARMQHFTPRQLKVLELLMTGASTRRTAAALNLAEATVSIHLAAIYRTTGVHSRAEAIAKLKEAGWGKS